ncbi:MAG: DUF1428 domain-containing protein [Sphingomicrobium sp.]
MAYLDAFVVPVPLARKDDYFAMARTFAEKAKALGAISGHEGWGDGLHPGETTSFPRAVGAKDNENVVFAYIVWPDKETRDKAWDAIMADPDMQPVGDMPFDGKRMFWGGFVPEVTYGEM